MEESKKDIIDIVSKSKNDDVEKEISLGPDVIKDTEIYERPDIKCGILLAFVFILTSFLCFFLKKPMVTITYCPMLFVFLAYLGWLDYKKRLVPSSGCIIVALFAIFPIINCLASHQYLGSLNYILGFLIALPLFIAALVSKNGGIGGGDIKLIAACGMVMGCSWGISMLISSFLLALIVMLIYAALKHKKENLSFALVPFISLGAILSFILF